MLALLHRNLDEFAEQITEFLDVNPEGKLSKVFLNLADHTTGKTVWLLAIGALAYAAVRMTEAYGLWRQREWAQWFALLSGALYLPGELYSLLKHASQLKWAVVAANALVVLFMLSLRIKAVRLPEPAYFGRTGSSYGAENRWRNQIIATPSGKTLSARVHSEAPVTGINNGGHARHGAARSLKTQTNVWNGNCISSFPEEIHL